MADPDHRYPSSSSSPAWQSPRLSSTSVKSTSQLTDSSSIRSRGRRQASSIRDGEAGNGADGSTRNTNTTSSNNNRLSGNDNDHGYGSSSTSYKTSGAIGGRNQERMQPIRHRGSSLLTATHPLESPAGSRASSRATGRSPQQEVGVGGLGLGQFFGDSLSQSWTSVQGLAASLIAAGEEQIGTVGRSRAKNWSPSPKFNMWSWDLGSRPEGDKGTNKTSLGLGSRAWGPAPPSQKPGIDDVATGSCADREAALKAARTASVLESHSGVNGGLDVTGNYKRRTSDEITPAAAQPEEYLAYIHEVQPNDTYAGLILRYKCRGDAFKKANGLWSNDSIQIRKWVTFPVDACELRGLPCEAPTQNRQHDAAGLMTTITALTTATHPRRRSNGGNAILEDPLSSDAPSMTAESDKDRPWTHVKWVRVDSFPQPVEIGRVSRQAMGFFPPRRKRSVTATSSVSASTPRQSVDFANPGSSPVGQIPTRRYSSLASQSRMLAGPTSYRAHATSSSDAASSSKPAWMRRPGGVGSMEHNVRAPGPEKDSLNKWMEKHMPSLNIDELPSMSIMGSETARLGFGVHESASIVESPFEQGHTDTACESSSGQGIGLDKAAMAVESWLRGALSRHPSSPLMASIRGRSASQDEGVGDLIELSQTAGDVTDDARQPPSHRRDGSPANTSQRDALKSEGAFRSRKTEWNPF